MAKRIATKPVRMWALVNKDTGDQFAHGPFTSNPKARMAKSMWFLKRYRIEPVLVTPMRKAR